MYEISQVSKLEFDGSKRFEYVEPCAFMYPIQKSNWQYKYKIALPEWPVLKEFGTPGDLRILCCNVNLFIRFTNTYWMNFLFRPGFITDLASVPKPLRGVVDNDDHKVIGAALVHDFLFSTHRIPFGIANSLFYKMLVANKYPKFNATLAYWAVSSFVGRKHWDKTTLKRARADWSNEHCEMRLSRPVQWEGKCYE